MNNRMENIFFEFDVEGKVIDIRPYGSGHINETVLITVKRADDSEMHYVMQKINTNIFTNPDELMENIDGVTSFLREKIIQEGGNPERETLNIIKTKNHKLYYKNEQGECWRVYNFITNAKSFDLIENKEDFYESAFAFGRFQSMLSDYPAEKLHETISGFHDTAARFEVFKKTVADDVLGRADDVREEIDFVLQHEELAYCLGEMLKQKIIPLRVTHNDTKLNNVMFDDETRKAICVIDLDTIMPGLAINDFGDSIRFGASTALEDEKDLSKVTCSMELYEEYVKGFIEGCESKLTPKEIELLPLGAKVMTYECGMRFLTDYLQGDTYFRISRPEHNLDRCRTQFKLVRDMEEKWDEMNEIIKKYIFSK